MITHRVSFHRFVTPGGVCAGKPPSTAVRAFLRRHAKPFSRPAPLPESTGNRPQGKGLQSQGVISWASDNHESGEDVEDQPATRGRGVEAFLEALEADAVGAHLADEGDEVLERPAEPGQFGDDQGVTGAGVLHRLNELGPVGLLAGQLVGEDLRSVSDEDSAGQDRERRQEVVVPGHDERVRGLRGHGLVPRASMAASSCARAVLMVAMSSRSSTGGRATTSAPTPWVMRSKPSSRSRASAARMVLRAAPYSISRSLMPGNMVPTGKSPARSFRRRSLAMSTCLATRRTVSVVTVYLLLCDRGPCRSRPHAGNAGKSAQFVPSQPGLRQRFRS